MDEKKEKMMRSICAMRDNFDPTDITDYYGLTNFLFRIINEQENDKEILTLIAETLNVICHSQVYANRQIKKATQEESFMFIHPKTPSDEKEQIYLSYPEDIKILLSRYVMK